MLIVGPDPNWQQRNEDNWNQALTVFLQVQQQKRQRDDQNLQQAISILANKPELAQGEFGDALIKQYGRRRPELAALVNSIRNKAGLDDQAENAVGTYFQKYGQALGQFAAEKNIVGSMPDALDVPVPIPGMPVLPVQIPNVAKQQRQAQLNMAPDPANAALSQMTPEQVRAAFVGAARLKINLKNETPPPPDGLQANDLPMEQRGLLAGGETVGSPKMQDAAAIAAGLKLSPSKLDEIAQRAAAKAEQDKYDQEQRNERAAESRALRQQALDQQAAFHQDVMALRSRDQDRKDAQAAGGAQQGAWAKGERKQAASDINRALAGSEKDGDKGLLPGAPVRVKAVIRDLTLQTLDRYKDKGLTFDVAVQQIAKRYQELAKTMPPETALATMRAALDAKLGSGQ